MPRAFGAALPEEDTFYKDFEDKHGYKYVRQVNRHIIRQRRGQAPDRRQKIELRTHRLSPNWGLVCIDQRCSILDVHYHVKQEVSQIIEGSFNVESVRTFALTKFENNEQVLTQVG